MGFLELLLHLAQDSLNLDMISLQNKSKQTLPPRKQLSYGVSNNPASNDLTMKQTEAIFIHMAPAQRAFRTLRATDVGRTLPSTGRLSPARGYDPTLAVLQWLHR